MCWSNVTTPSNVRCHMLRISLIFFNYHYWAFAAVCSEKTQTNDVDQQAQKKSNAILENRKITPLLSLAALFVMLCSVAGLFNVSPCFNREAAQEGVPARPGGPEHKRRVRGAVQGPGVDHQCRCAPEYWNQAPPATNPIAIATKPDKTRQQQHQAVPSVRRSLTATVGGGRT